MILQFLFRAYKIVINYVFKIILYHWIHFIDK